MKTKMISPSFTEQQYVDTGRAFDSVASDYDGPLGNNLLVQQMREVLWRIVAELAAPGSRLLDLGCGTGLDALHFAQSGYGVTAIDWSVGMVAQTRRRAEQAGLSGRLITARLGIQELDRLAGETFDVIYSDLGALNCLPDLTSVAQNCAGLLRPDGYMVCSVIGRYCPWEIAYYALRGNLKRARVRLAQDHVPVSLNGYTVWTRYYSPREFFRSFAAWFKWRACRAINLFIPPPYLVGPFERHPFLLKPLAWLDHHAGRLPVINQAGDHFLLVMSRSG
jgi:SAM-dependent methyltransferase